MLDVKIEIKGLSEFSLNTDSESKRSPFGTWYKVCQSKIQYGAVSYSEVQ